jgi:hypothetical protein
MEMALIHLQVTFGVKDFMADIYHLTFIMANKFLPLKVSEKIQIV